MQPHRLGPLLAGQVTNMQDFWNSLNSGNFVVSNTSTEFIFVESLTHLQFSPTKSCCISHWVIWMSFVCTGGIVWFHWVFLCTQSDWASSVIPPGKQLLELCLSTVSWKLSCSVLLENFWLGFCKKIRLPYLSFCAWIKISQLPLQTVGSPERNCFDLIVTEERFGGCWISCLCFT